jgi:hypothetical protein
VSEGAALTQAERVAHGRRADTFPRAQMVYSLTDVEMLIRARAGRVLDENGGEGDAEDFMDIEGNYYDPPGGVPEHPWEQ